jgi:hypothetical protein
MFFQYTNFPPSSLFTAFSLWTQAFRHNNHDVAHRAQKLDGKPPAPAPIRARARYAEYCAHKGALSKANQAMTSDLTPSSAPTNINELRAKNPEPTHPDRDLTTQPASLIWPQKADTVRGGRKKTGKSTFSRTSVSSTLPRTSAHTGRCQRRTLTGGVCAN